MFKFKSLRRLISKIFRLKAKNKYYTKGSSTEEPKFKGR